MRGAETLILSRLGAIEEDNKGPTMSLPRFETLIDPEAVEDNAPPTAAKDAEHASTGWSAYDVWRARVFNTPKTDAELP